MTHEDDRRLLIDWGHGENWKVCKTIFVKKDVVLGNHFHKIKTESFMLVKGKGLLNGMEMQIGDSYHVLPGEKHSFSLKKGSILIGLASEFYNKSDDYES